MGNVILDGKIVKIQPEKQYLDNDDYTDEQDISQPSEMGDLVRVINDDKLDSKSRLSDIDFKTRIHSFAMPSINAVQSLQIMKFLPANMLSVIRVIKRNAVSEAGLGRKEHVEMATAGVQRNVDQGRNGVFGKIAGIFKGKDEQK